MLRKNMFNMNASSEDSNYECDELLIRKLDEKMAAEKKKIDGELNRHISKMLNVFSVGFLINAILFALGVLFLCFYIGDLLNNDTVQMAYLIGGMLSLIAAFAIYVYRTKIKKPHAESQEYETFSDEMDRFYDLCARSLNVPEKAQEVEIYTYLYTEEKGVRENFCSNNAYINETMKIFEEDGKLCIYCADSVWGVPIDSIDEIVEIKENIFFSEWDKEIPHNKGDYMQYRIEELPDGDYKINGYYTIKFNYNDSHYEILVPKYEIEHFNKIINLNSK